MARAEAAELIKMLLEVNESSAPLQPGGTMSSVGRVSCWPEDNSSACKLLIKLHQPRGVCESEPGKQAKTVTTFLFQKTRTTLVAS